jgi:hypothetical protein
MVAVWPGLIQRAQARQRFERLVGNGFSFREYSVAAGHLFAEEQPFAWLKVSLRGVFRPRVLITNRRILVFSGRLRAQSLSFVSESALEEVAWGIVQWQGPRRADVRIHLTARAAPHELTLRRLPVEAAREVEGFLNASADGRANLIRERIEVPATLACVVYYLAVRLAENPVAGMLTSAGLAYALVVIRGSGSTREWWIEVAVGGALVMIVTVLRLVRMRRLPRRRVSRTP